MAYDEQTADRLRAILGREGKYVEKRMFGGLCFMVEGGMCCGLTSEALMVRVGAERHAEALAQPHARPMDFTGRPLTGMVYVDPAGYRTDRELARWVARGLEGVRSKAASTAKPPAARARKRTAQG